MINARLRTRIQRLRSEGKSYAAINEMVGESIAKGTLSYICRDVVLPEWYYQNQLAAQQERLVGMRVKAARTNKFLRIERMMNIYDRALYVINNKSSLNDEKIHLAMLFKGEGAKYQSGYRGLALSNSDSKVLKIYISLLEKVYFIKHEEFPLRVMARADQDLEKLQHYWSQELKAPLCRFYKPFLDARTAGKPTKRLNYKGVCVVSCKGTDIQIELDMIANLYADKLWGVSSSG